MVGFQSKINSEKIYFPKGCVLTYSSYGASVFGESILIGAFSPWWDKYAPLGSEAITRIRMIKDSLIGDVFYFPTTHEVKDDLGNVVDMQQMCAAAANARVSGSSMILPDVRDANGNRTLTYDPPKDTGNPTGIWIWRKDLDDKILLGIGVPPETITAGGTGSGYAGREIPMRSLVGGVSSEYKQLASGLITQVINPMVRINYGIQKYTINVVRLSDSYSKMTNPEKQTTEESNVV